MKRVLLILNQPAYGADETFNAVRLANALARRGDAEATVFLMGDAVTCATAGQKTPNGYYTLDRMLRTFARHGGPHRLLRDVSGRARPHQGTPHRRGLSVHDRGAGGVDRRSRPGAHLLTPHGPVTAGAVVPARLEDRSQ